MRIGLFVPFFPQRSETFVIDQAADLLVRDHDVRIYCLGGARTGRDHPRVRQHHLLARTRWLMTPHRHRHDKVLRAAARAARHFPRSVSPLLALRRRDVGRGMKIPSAAAAMGVLAGSHPLRFDVIQAHFGHMAIVVDALREMGLVAGPLVATFHGSDVSAWGRSDPDRYRGLFDRVDAVTANSCFLRDRLLSRGAPPARTTRLPIGVDPDRFRKQPLPDGPPRFITVARLSEEKDVATAVRAMAILRDRGRRFRYTVIGDGPRRGEIEAVVRELRLDDRVDFRGPVPHHGVVDALAGHHVFVLPGVEADSGAVEAQGLVLVEAQAVGRPVVAAAVGGVPETVGEGAGRLVEPGDSMALADGLDAVLGERMRWSEMGAAGRRHVEMRFDRRRLNDQLVELYRSVGAGAL